MAIALHSFLVDEEGKVPIAHVFYAKTEAAARRLLEQHAAACPCFGPAHHAGDTIEIVEEIEALPEADEDELLEFLGLGEEEWEEDI